MLNIYAKRIEKYVLPYCEKFNSYVPKPVLEFNFAFSGMNGS